MTQFLQSQCQIVANRSRGTPDEWSSGHDYVQPPTGRDHEFVSVWQRKYGLAGVRLDWFCLLLHAYPTPTLPTVPRPRQARL